MPKKSIKEICIKNLTKKKKNHLKNMNVKLAIKKNVNTKLMMKNMDIQIHV